MSEISTVVIGRNSDTVERFAAGELAKYAETMSGQAIAIADASSESAIYVGSFPGDKFPGEREKLIDDLAKLHQDGFIIRSVSGNVIIQGKTSRATLYGVYDYLRMLGVRWYFPGSENEFVP